MSEFAHAMAHDLKNPLLSIEGYANLLQIDYAKTYAERIGQLTALLSALLQRSVVLADAGLIIEKTHEVNLSALVQTVAEASIPESITFNSDELPTVEGDQEKLAQVFQNLFENAVIHGRPHQIAVRRYDSKDGIKLLITNDGASIPHEHRSKIFDRRFTTKEDVGGLGLAIVKKLVTAHGWQIFVEETAETTFRIVIPTSKKP